MRKLPTIVFDPPDFLQQAAVDERRTQDDWTHCDTMLTEAFTKAFRVKKLQRTELGVIAYRSAHVNWENAAVVSGEDKPVLRALEDLSKKLLAHKREGRARVLALLLKGPARGRTLSAVERFPAMPGRVETGVFGAKMEVELVNDGPATIVLDM